MTRRGDFHILLAGLAISVALLGAASCGETSSTEIEAGSVCLNDGECDDELVCRYGYCSAQEARLDNLDFRISPSESSAYVSQQVSGVSVGGASTPDFALGRPRRLRGTISIGDEDGVGPSGRVFLHPKETDGATTTRTVDVYNGDFETLVPSGWYDISFEPERADEIPKTTWKNQELTGDTNLVRTIPSASELVQLDGSVEFEGRAFSKARVVGATEEGRLETTADVLGTSSARRSFSLGALPRAATYDLLVRGSFTAGVDGHQIRIRVDDWLDVGREDVESGGVRRGPTEITGLEQGLVPGTVRLRTPADRERNVDWSGTNVVFRTSFDDLSTSQGGSGVEGSLSWSVTLGEQADTDATDPDDGVLRPNLVPAAYEVWVVPPPDSGLAARRVDFDLRRAGGDRITVELEAKRRIVGRIVDARGDPVPNARVDFHRQNRADRDPRPLQTGTPARTDDDGRFATRVAPVGQTATIQPPSNSGHPVALETLAAEEVRRDEPLEMRLAQPYAVRGAVYGRTAEGGARAVGDARVEISRTVGGRNFLLDTISTDSEGRFFALLPASF